jgi:hypothetical protein
MVHESRRCDQDVDLELLRRSPVPRTRSPIPISVRTFLLFGPRLPGRRSMIIDSSMMRRLTQTRDYILQLHPVSMLQFRCVSGRSH